jgi:hypothetical protein
MAQLGMIIALIAMLGAGAYYMHGTGEDSKSAELSPIIEGWEKRYNKLNNDNLIANLEGGKETAEYLALLASIGKITEISNAKRKEEIKAESDKYLDRLFNQSNGLLGYPKETNSVYTGKNPRRLLSDLARALPDSCVGKRELFEDLRELDRRFAEEIHIPANKVAEELRDLKEYVQRLDKENNILKSKNDYNQRLIDNTQQ